MKEQKMNKILAGILAVSMTAGIVSAQEPVLSRNAVGYIKHELPAGFSVIQNTFEPLELAMTIANTFGALPNLTRLHLWNGSAYQTITKTALGWGNAGTNVIRRGDAFWIEIPSTVGTNTVSLVLMGEVPDEISAPTTDMDANPGFNFIGFPYPASRAWSNTIFAASSPNLSRLHIWTGSGYQTFTKTALGWGAAGALIMEPGQGFWLEWPSTSSPQTLSVEKPYDWP
jgi:hypothetical protein